MLFNDLDSGSKGYLNKEECLALLNEIHGLFLNKVDAADTNINAKQYDLLWEVIDHDANDKLYVCDLIRALEAYEIWQYEKTDKELKEELYDETDDNSLAKKYMRMMAGPRYELVMNIFGIANILSLYFKSIAITSDTQEH